MDVSPAYVEADDFRVIGEWEIGIRGWRYRVRCYRLRANPDQRPREKHDPFLYTVAAEYALAGFPRDVVMHLGEFWRVTSIPEVDLEAAQTNSQAQG